MLSGVGGRSIEEAKEALSYGEALAWFEYRKKHGPLHALPRIEWALAQVAHMVASAGGLKKKGGGDFQLDDFLPFKERPKLTLRSAMKALGVKR